MIGYHQFYYNFNKNIVIGRFFRKCGAFFIKRRRGDEIYDSLLQSYLEYLLKGNNTIEFFIEGGRSRFGKIASPKVRIVFVRLYINCSLKAKKNKKKKMESFCINLFMRIDSYKGH